MTRSQAMAITRRYEGCRLKAYRDTRGYRTIGIGHMLFRDEGPEEITQAQADDMFGRDYPIAVRMGCILLGHHIPPDGAGDDPDALERARDLALRRSAEAKRQWEAGEIDSRHAAFYDASFNLGARLDDFTGLRLAWQDGDWIMAGDELMYRNPHTSGEPVLTPYAEQVGQRAKDNAYRIRTNQEPA